MSMRFILCIVWFCLIFISVKCLEGECPYGKNALKNNIPIEVFGRKVNDSLQSEKAFEDDIDGHIKDMREYIDTQNLTSEQPLYYMLFTDKNPRDPYYMTFDRQNFMDSPYVENNPTAFMLHGFGAHPTYYNDGIIGAIKEGLLDIGNYNVIYPDFRSAIEKTYYGTIKNGYLVAKNVSAFINFLKDNSATQLKDIQLIGLSIGAQIVSHIGEYTPGIGRISALDPSETIYGLLPYDMRLSPHDAEFVDVIHTNGGHFPYEMGIYRRLGHLDFYVNGGRSQTNCNSTEPISEEPRDGAELVARVCMHDRATDYFVTSMCKGCTYIGVACESYEEFEMGICNKYNSRTAIMGQFATKPKYPLPGELKYFVDTNDKWPYCRNNTIPRDYV